MIRVRSGRRGRRWHLGPGTWEAMALLLLSFLLGGPRSAAQDELAQDAWGTSAAREALREQDYPWYDKIADDLQALEVDPVVPPPEARNGKLKLPDWDVHTPSWSGQLGFWQVFEKLIWGVLIGLLVGMMVYFLHSAIRDNRFTWGSGRPSNVEELAHEFAQIENLPFPIARPQADLLAETRYHYENGDYGQAIIYLFSYQLVQLDKHHLIRLAKGKTNRQYLRELDSPGNSLRAMLRQTMIAFEEVFFGNHPMPRQDFEDCWRQLDEFHRHVQGVVVR